MSLEIPSIMRLVYRNQLSFLAPANNEAQAYLNEAITRYDHQIIQETAKVLDQKRGNTNGLFHRTKQADGVLAIIAAGVGSPAVTGQAESLRIAMQAIKDNEELENNLIPKNGL